MSWQAVGQVRVTDNIFCGDYLYKYNPLENYLHLECTKFDRNDDILLQLRGMSTLECCMSGNVCVSNIY